MQSLPTDLLFEISRYLSTKDISRLLQTCRKCSDIYGKETFWTRRREVLNHPTFINLKTVNIDFAITVKEGVCTPVEYNGILLTYIF